MKPVFYFAFAVLSCLLLSCGNKEKDANQDVTGKTDSSSVTQQTATPTDSVQEKVHIPSMESLVGEWVWKSAGEDVEGEDPSDIQLTLSLVLGDKGTLTVDECTIYGSTAAFNLDCSWNNGVLRLFDKKDNSNEFSSLKAELRPTPYGDLTGSYTSVVGEKKESGHLSLTRKI